MADQNVRVERFAMWLWSRWRMHFRIAVAVVAVVLVVMFINVSTALLIAMFFELTAVDVLRFFALHTVVNVVVLGAGYLCGLSEPWARIQAWVEGDRREPAATMAAALTVGSRMIRQTVAIATVAYAVTITPYWARAGDLSAAGVLSWWLSVLGSVFISVMLIGTSLELLMRPLRAEISIAFPGAAGAVAQRRAPLAIRIAVISGAFAWAMAFLVAGIVSLFDSSESKWAAAAVGGGVLVAIYGPLFLYSTAVVPVLRPIEDLTDAAHRVRVGTFTQPVAVTSNDDLGALAVAFNLMQDGLRERERLHAAFGAYVDPALAARLLADGDESFSGERVDVTALFVDVRDFTAFAEASSPEATVARLNQLFELVVPIIASFGGHTNKFLGDGALAVFGAPVMFDDHADRAVAAAIEIDRRVRDRFDEAVRIGIGVNTGEAIAGTIGGGGKLEFTIIGDPVNVAARVEQLTKVTGDVILLTEATAQRMQSPPPDLHARGVFELKGKRTKVRLYACGPVPTSPS